MYKRFLYAFKGIKVALTTERSFLNHLLSAISVIVLGILFSITTIEWILIVICLMIMVVTEFVNTAIEHILNFVHPDFHPKVGITKDIAAGAVLIVSLGSLLVACIIFIPKIISFLSS